MSLEFVEQLSIAADIATHDLQSCLTLGDAMQVQDEGVPDSAENASGPVLWHSPTRRAADGGQVQDLRA